MRKKSLLLAVSAALALGLPAIAAADPVGYLLNYDLDAGPYTVALGNNASYTFSLFNSPSSGTIGVSVGGNAMVYGNGFLTPNQPDPLQQGVTVPTQLSLGEFFKPSGTAGIAYSAALDYIALEFTSAGSTYFGYAEVGGDTLYRLAYNDTPGGSIVTGQSFTALPNAAVPEPASWALMIAGFGLVGAGLRRARLTPLAA